MNDFSPITQIGIVVIAVSIMIGVGYAIHLPHLTTHASNEELDRDSKIGNYVLVIGISIGLILSIIGIVRK